MSVPAQNGEEWTGASAERQEIADLIHIDAVFLILDMHIHACRRSAGGGLRSASPPPACCRAPCHMDLIVPVRAGMGGCRDDTIAMPRPPRPQVPRSSIRRWARRSYWRRRWFPTSSGTSRNSVDRPHLFRNRSLTFLQQRSGRITGKIASVSGSTRRYSSRSERVLISQPSLGVSNFGSGTDCRLPEWARRIEPGAVHVFHRDGCRSDPAGISINTFAKPAPSPCRSSV